MKAVERAPRRFRIEGTHDHVVAGKKIKKRARNGGLADPAFIRPDHNQRWLHLIVPRPRYVEILFPRRGFRRSRLLRPGRMSNVSNGASHTPIYSFLARAQNTVKF